MSSWKDGKLAQANNALTWAANHPRYKPVRAKGSTNKAQSKLDADERKAYRMNYEQDVIEAQVRHFASIAKRVHGWGHYPGGVKGTLVKLTKPSEVTNEGHRF